MVNALYSTKTINKPVPGSYRAPGLGVHPLKGIKFTSRLLQERILDRSIKREPCFIVERVVNELSSRSVDKTQDRQLKYLSEISTMVAIRQGKELVQALIPTLPENLAKYWVRINNEDAVEDHLLTAAAWIGDLELVKNLAWSFIRRGRSINPVSHYMFTPLWAAARNGHASIVSWLLKKGVKDKIFREPITSYDSALCAACIGGHIKVVQLILRQDRIIGGEEMKNALRATAINGQLSIMVILLYRVIEHFQRGEMDKVPVNLYCELTSVLWLACQNGSTEIAEVLLGMGINPDRTDDAGGRTCIQIAAANGQAETVKLLLRHGVDCTSSSFRQPCPIVLAAGGGFVETVRILLDRGSGEYPGHCWPSLTLKDAARGGHAEVVALLLARGFDIEEEHAGDAAVNAACQEGYSSIVKILADHGCHIHGTGKYFKPKHQECSPGVWSLLGFTPCTLAHRPKPMEVATQSRRDNVIQTLIELGVKYEPNTRASSPYEDF
ncbi:nacht and ankyrin domain protein [Phlyctema vagabunda]|uniref:Nacht and ankyrin domain protein n=1 Tax=Phlyctema vagabunda TaxID=108571 RepID=A0ABR4PWH5_9HELO